MGSEMCIRDRNYIIGNPPFVGARLMNVEQKNDLLTVFGEKWKNVGNLDYVSGWYKKAADLMTGTNVRTALVSTNSICQGESVANLWKPLMEEGMGIFFAHRTFRWDSEATLKAHVHCVIVGFADQTERIAPKYLFDGEDCREASQINGYLVEAENVFAESRNKSLCDVPVITKGCQPTDGGFLIIEDKDLASFVSKEPLAKDYIRKFIGAKEFINNQNRWCLWLVDAKPSDLKKMPLVMERVKGVRETRLKSSKAATRLKADTPTIFDEIRVSQGEYILVPSVSSERREYVPMGFMSPDVICSNLVFLIPNSTLYHFGILTSWPHMAWMRAVCGRLKSDYRYSKDIVYNNYPWPELSTEGTDAALRAAIERTAQAILDARARYPDSSLADLYDPLTMPAELRRAHRDNDRAVCRAYGFPAPGPDFTETDCVARLFERYCKLTQ